MVQLTELIKQELEAAFDACGYDKEAAVVSLSNRPDLCEFQCNGAMRLAKPLKKAPIEIAENVAARLSDSKVLSSAEAVKPGFLNLKVKEEALADLLTQMLASDTYGYETAKDPETIIIDYGGPNVAKPLHVGHLRAAVIGESIKRILRFSGHNVIGDVHLGDWGLQMGLIITELEERQPDLVYFDENYNGDYPEEAPFTVSELEEIYPTASAKSKEDEAYKERALSATAQLQAGRKGYQAILSHILNVSVTDLKRNYKNLNVEFDLWLGESDAQKYVPDMVQGMIDSGLARESEGALVVDIAEESDSKELPPCIIRKSDGASLYATTDLATLVQRTQDYHPDRVIYVVDKRQELHFTQVFRTARKAGIVEPKTELLFKGFGTMNGKDGKPFKTREGGVMRLETLMNDINDEMYNKILANKEERKETDFDEKEAMETAKIVALSALKYGDLSNQASKNYIFDLDRFTSFEGNTGPYLLYTIVRMKSILRKYKEQTGLELPTVISAQDNATAKALMLEVTKFSSTIQDAADDTAPHKICSYIYALANAFNHFYHETVILTEPNEEKKKSYIALLSLTEKIMETSIDLLGFGAPDRM